MNHIVPMETFRVKGDTEDWFDGEIMDCIKDKDKLLKRYKKTKLQIDFENFKKAKNNTKKIIKKKKISYYENTIRKNTGNSKKLWNTLKSMGLTKKKGNSANICLKTNEKIVFDAKENANSFMNFYTNIAGNLIRKLSQPKGKFGRTFVQEYYKNLEITQNSFCCSKVSEDFVLDLLMKIKTNKAAGIDGLCGRSFKDGAPLLVKPITELINLSIDLSAVPDKPKIAKLKPLFKKGSSLCCLFS